MAAEIAGTQTGLPEAQVAQMASVGSTLEALGGAAAVVLAIVGLAAVEPLYMQAIAAIVLGATLVAQSATKASEYSDVAEKSGAAQWLAVGFENELGAEAMAGGAVVILGILAILDIHTLVLGAIAAIVLGVGFLLGSIVNARLNTLNVEVSSQHELTRKLARGASAGAIGAQVLVGGAAIILGILGLVSMTHDASLVLTAMLVLGAAALLSGGALGSRMANMMAK